MSETFLAKPLRVTSSRPTDATGCFWAFISLVAGCFFAAIFPPFAIVLAAIPLFLSWQLKKWRTDISIVKAAKGWCAQYYPNADGTPVVDFMIALGHVSDTELSKCMPETTLDTLNWMSDDDQAAIWYPDINNRTRAWLFDVFADARIKSIDLSAFDGSTLGDVIHVLLLAKKRDLGY